MTQAETKAEQLEDLKGRFEELLYEAREIMRATGMIGRRAEAYWIGHIEGALDNRGSMVTMQKTIDELYEKSNIETCPECGSKPGEGHAEDCPALEETD